MKRYAQLAILIAVDALTIVLALYLALYLRFEGNIPLVNLSFVSGLIPVLVPAQILIYFYFGLYSRLWWYASIKETGSSM